jgi:hypothetical protein
MRILDIEFASKTHKDIQNAQPGKSDIFYEGIFLEKLLTSTKKNPYFRND